MTQNKFREILFAPVHSLVALAFVVAAAGSVASFSLAESREFTPVVASDAWVQASSVSGSVLGVSTPVPVVWTGLVNMIAEGGDLEQVSGSCVGCADAGAYSSQQITTGDGYFEFTIAPGTYHYVYAGLNTDVSSSTAATMPFAFEISDSYVSIREQGVYKSDTSFVAGDVFRVSIESGVVKYYKNGSVFYTSAAAPVYPLVADVSMQSVGSLLWGAKIATSDVVVAPAAPVITSFTASPLSITSGQSTRLSWSVADATSLFVNQGVGTVTGTTGETVSPTSTTTYTLTATNTAGATTTATVTVSVTPVEVPPAISVCNTAVPRGQFTGCYYNNKDFTAFKFSRTDSYPINFDWGKRSPSGAISSDTFSVRWIGQFEFGSGEYVFTSAVDDGVRLYIDDTLVIDKWSNTPGTYSATLSVVAGWHTVRMDYYENRGYAKVGLSWLKSTTTPTPAPTPTISSFTASPASITSGSSTLSWTVSGATSLSLNQNIGTVTGTTSKVVTPTATTTYTLTATNSSGSVTSTATVTVNAVTPTTIVDGYGDTLLATQFNGWFFSQVGDTAAVITYENTADSTKTYTQTASRTVTRTDAETWLKSTYGTNFAITQPLGFSVNPSSVVTAPGTYRITSVKLNTSNTNILLGPSAQGTFTIAAPVATLVISSFTASPTSITTGQSSTLSWNVSGATSLSLSQSIGTVTGTTSKVVSPTATTTYTLTATNSSGSVTSNVTVTVSTVVVPPVVTTSTVELPRVYVDSSYPTLPANRTIRSVKASCSGATNCYVDLQAALDVANPGDEIVIDSGLQLLAPDGGFVLRNGAKSNPNNYYTIVRSANVASLPASGSRVSPSYASQMPKILSTGVTPAIITNGPANYIRFVGIEISLTTNAVGDANAGGVTCYNLVLLGNPTETNPANLPHHIVFDRAYVHGAPTKNVRRGFFLNTGAVAVVDSYVADFHEIGADTQAILGANGTGPYKVVNNYLEAAGENLMVGGLDVPNMPADFEIRNNYFYKPTKWMSGGVDYAGYAWVVKNLFETKYGLRWFIDGNVFENNWPMGQTGMAINMKSSNQDGGMNQAETGHVTFTNNIVRHSTWAMSIHSKDTYSGGSAVNLHHLHIANNLFDDIGVWGMANTIQIDESPYVTFDHNTFLNDRNNSAVVLYGNPSTSFAFTNNILGLAAYGIKGDGQASGTPSINQYLPGSVVTKNVFYGANTSPYPTGNYMAPSVSGVGFANYNNGNGGNYTLSSSSVYKNGGTDGKDPGVNTDTLTTATACVVSGSCGGYTPPPPAPAPTISSFTASPTSITSGSSTLSWSVTGATSLSIDQGVGTVTGATSKVVTLTATTTYILTATNSSGSVTALVTVTVNTVAPSTIVDGYGDALSATSFTGWFYSQVGDTAATITYEDVNDATKTYIQTASRTVTRTDAEQWLRTTYGTNFTITQPLGFSVNPSSIVTTPGTYRIKSVKLNTSNTTILLSTGAQGTFSVAATPPPAGNATVTVNTSQRYQIMNGWEAVSQSGAMLESNTTNGQSNVNPNFAQYKNSLYDQAVADGINRLRLELYSYTENSTDYFNQYINGQISFDTLKTKWYQVVNDNADVNSINASGFKFSQLDFDIDNYVLPMKQRLEAKGEQLALSLCFVHFSASTSVHSTNGNEYGELMLATFQHMQSKYGFVPSTIELMLEPDNGTPFNGTILGNAMLGTQTKLAAAGFTPKFILPSTTSMQNTVSYFDAAKNVVGAAFITQNVEEISYHLYGGYSSTTVANILSRATQYGVKTAQLEYIGATVDDLLKDLTEANASAWQQFAIAFPGGTDDGSTYYLINGTTVTPGSRMKLLRQYFKYVRKGAVRVGASSTNSALNPVAFENSNGKQVVIVKSTGSSTFTIGGIAAGTYGVMYTVNGTTTNGSDILLSSGQNLSTSIPGAGIVTVYQK